MSDVRVQDVMTHLVVTLRPTDSLHEAAQRLARNHVSGAPVVEEGKVVGVVSESDIIHAVTPPQQRDRGASILDLLSVMGRARSSRGPGKTVAEMMSPLVIEISPEASIWKAALVMERKGVKRLPVVDDEGYLLGIVSRADLVKAVAKDDDQIRTDVIEAVEVLGEESFSDLVVEVADGVAILSGTADRKSTRELAIKLAARTPGVVEVVSRLGYDLDDTHLKSYRSQWDTKDPRLDWHTSAREGL